jgi:Translation initiation factor eIF3 subunit.
MVMLNIVQSRHCDCFGMLQQRLREEAEKKEKERETEQELTPEEIQKLQEEADLRVAMETFGVCNSLF